MATKTKAAKKRKQPSDADRVKATAAAPHASLAGTEHVLETSDQPLKVTVLDGARATLEVTDHEPLSQAQLQAAVKLLSQAIQETY